MDKEFITCLDNIIEIEQTKIVQEKVMEKLDETINNLGKPKKIPVPVKKKAEAVTVNYETKSTYYDSENAENIQLIISAIFAVIGFIYGAAKADDFTIINGIIYAVIAFIIGTFAGWLVGCIVNWVKVAGNSVSNYSAGEAAQVKADALYNQNVIQAEKDYQESLKRYEIDCANDKKRVEAELITKEEMKVTLKEVQHRHECTSDLLVKYYDAADIYETYRNVVAMCYINEYMKSGICTELVGPYGAYNVFREAMYHEHGIRLLDSIATKLDVLHFDNKILNARMAAVNSQLDGINRSINDMAMEQKASNLRKEQLLEESLNEQRRMREDMNAHNAVSQFNQATLINEAKQLKQLEWYNTNHN